MASQARHVLDSQYMSRASRVVVPEERGERSSPQLPIAYRGLESPSRISERGDCNQSYQISQNVRTLHPLLGERDGVRADKMCFLSVISVSSCEFGRRPSANIRVHPRQTKSDKGVDREIRELRETCKAENRHGSRITQHQVSGIQNPRVGGGRGSAGVRLPRSSRRAALGLMQRDFQHAVRIGRRGLLDGENEDFATSDFGGLRPFHDGRQGCVQLIVREHQLDFDFGD
jgi:hypothetical protein